ncbi:MAG: DUF924 domain-containing protein [Hyphomicrobiaceae bacterium]|nr:DUF924 domain-containing protein [Hyphomicrobiaceae bacterium]
MTAEAQISHDPAWVADVLTFWFSEIGNASWFVKRDETDASIRDRFEALYLFLAGEPAEAALTSPHRTLATIIVLDQFPRNMYRGTARAFAADALARDIARAAIVRGLDKALDVDGRLFLYLPLEHSEQLADQDRAVALIAELGDDTYLSYARAHQDVIARFGRFPHRNAALGRRSTSEEIAYLSLPGSGF